MAIGIRKFRPPHADLLRRVKAIQTVFQHDRGTPKAAPKLSNIRPNIRHIGRQNAKR